MRKVFLLGVVSAFVLTNAAMADICGGVAGNLVTNCGFETGDFTGWTQSGLTDHTVVSGPAFGDGLTPNSGNFFAALGPIGGDGFLTQTLNTTAGGNYTVSLFLASDGFTPNDFSVNWGGTSIYSAVNIPASTYQLLTFTEAASAATTDLSIGFRNDPGYLALDDVSVTQNQSVAPEPAYFVVLGAGLVALFAFRRRFSQPAAVGREV